MGATTPDLRGGVFQQALVDGGVNPAAVSAATSAAFHCATPRRWRGPTTLDYTSPALRLVTPSLRKYQFPNFDFQTSEGERRGRIDPSGSGPEEEEIPVPLPEPYTARPDLEQSQPEGDSGDGQYFAGRYSKIKHNTISVLASRTGVAILDSDRIVGGSITVAAKPPADKYISVDKAGDFIDREWNLTFRKTPRSIKVVTGLEVDAARRCLVVKKVSIDAWLSESQSNTDAEIPFERVTPVTNGRVGGGLDFLGPAVYYLGAAPEGEGTVLFTIPLADCEAK
jgi:hypothetical protein